MKNITILDLIEKFKNIDEGEYKYNNYQINIKRNEDENIVNIAKNNNEIEIDINKNSYVIKNKDLDLYVYNKVENANINKIGKYVKDNRHYFIYENSIQEENKEKYELNSNNILKKVHDLVYIGKEITTNKNYIYYKKSNSEQNEFNENYLKIPVTEKMLNSISKFNNFSGMNKIKMNLIKEFIGEELFELISSLDLSKIINKITNEFKELEEMSTIYKNTKNYLNIDETILNEINEFIELMLSNLLEQKIMTLKNSFNNAELKNIDNLKSLKKDINEVIKLQRKENIKKLINKK